VKVKLDAYEMLNSGYIGLRRNLEALVRGRSPRFAERYPGELWAYHVQGAMAEQAFCKAMGRYWGGGINTFHVSDVEGCDVDVRWSNGPTLKVRADDRGRIVKMRGVAPEFEVVGWIEASEAKRPEWLADPGNRGAPAYFVPDDRLQEAWKLKAILSETA